MTKDLLKSIYINKVMRCDNLKLKIEQLEPRNAKTIIKIVEDECEFPSCKNEELLLEKVYSGLLRGVDYSKVKSWEDIIYANAKFDVINNSPRL